MISIFDSLVLGAGRWAYDKAVSPPGAITRWGTKAGANVTGALAKAPGNITYGVGSRLLKNPDIAGVAALGLGASLLRRRNLQKKKEKENRREYSGVDTSSIRDPSRISEGLIRRSLQSFASKFRPIINKMRDPKLKDQQIHARVIMKKTKADPSSPKGLGKLVG